MRLSARNQIPARVLTPAEGCGNLCSQPGGAS